MSYERYELEAFATIVSVYTKFYLHVLISITLAQHLQVDFEMQYKLPQLGHLLASFYPSLRMLT